MQPRCIDSSRIVSFTPLSRALSEQPAFTFIDHDNDLASKSIKDVKSRKAIWSHVMRDVRCRERLAGLKRVSRRDDPKSSDPSSFSDTFMNKSPSENLPHEHLLSLRPLRSDCSMLLTDGREDAIPSRNRQWQSTMNPKEVVALTHQVPSSHSNVDPFHTLPGAIQYPTITQKLLQYRKAFNICLFGSIYILICFQTLLCSSLRYILLTKIGTKEKK